jgi:hypothetical protein
MAECLIRWNFAAFWNVEDKSVRCLRSLVANYIEQIIGFD